MSYLNRHNPIIPTQREPLDDTQILNAAGGYVYQIDEFDALRRFLIIGTERGSLYESERDLTKQNVDNTIKAIKSDGKRVVNMVREVSDGGQARRNDMALFVLALCLTHGDNDTKIQVSLNYNNIARTGTHHLMFCNFIENMRGWGRAVKRTVSGWYELKSDQDLAYQVVKYRNREGFTHQKALHRCHGGKNTPLYRWIMGRDIGTRSIKRGLGDAEKITFYEQATPLTSSEHGIAISVYPKFLQGFMRAQELDGEVDKKSTLQICSLIEDYGLTHEMIPNQFLASPKVWEALLTKMPITATIRNLGRLTSLGLLEPFSEHIKTIKDKLTPESVRKARLHPLTTLIASTTYASGSGVKGNLTWTPNQQISGHLEDVFYWGFDSIQPTYKNIMLALDVSASMFWHGPFSECPSLTCGEVAAVMAMATLRSEKNATVFAFDNRFREIPITDKSSLADVIRAIQDLRRTASATDCALPMLTASKRNWNNIDGFAVYTDNDTWYGDTHPKQALEMYRKQTGVDSRMIAVSMLATDTTIADGSVPYMMDIVGMSTDTPRMVSQYLNGEF